MRNRKRKPARRMTLTVQSDMEDGDLFVEVGHREVFLSRSMSRDLNPGDVINVKVTDEFEIVPGSRR